jgi:hypothetical protein
MFPSKTGEYGALLLSQCAALVVSMLVVTYQLLLVYTTPYLGVCLSMYLC